MADQKKSFIKPLILLSAILFILTGTFCGIVVSRDIEYSKLTQAYELTEEEKINLLQQMKLEYSDKNEILQPLPYTLQQPSLPIWAESAILIDISNGSILYEKNADEVIPPASMTKLFALYIVDEEVSAGRLSYDQIIPVPEESLACNMPPHSSLMFLGEGQIVTLEELILGLSICSGNDAAYALAYTISGSMEAFIERMNKVAADLDLKNTHFVESSGYSAENTSTAREMAKFCRVYLTEHPESLARFHSVPSFTYPKAHNMAPGDNYGPQDFSEGFPRHITMGITQKNTNPMLDYPGCDGLKTGYIDESGYNLSLTAKRGNTRFLSITMKGPGVSKMDGQKGRIHDGTQLMDFAFGSFADYEMHCENYIYPVKVFGSKEKIINLVPAFDVKTICTPYITGSSMEENLKNIEIIVEKPVILFGSVQMGQRQGSISVKLGNHILETIPLVADRNTTEENGFIQLVDKLIAK